MMADIADIDGATGERDDQYAGPISRSASRVDSSVTPSLLEAMAIARKLRSKRESPVAPIRSRRSIPRADVAAFAQGDHGVGYCFLR